MTVEISATVSDAIDEAAHQLTGAGIDAARHEARLLLSHVTGLDLARLIAEPDWRLSEPDQTRFADLVERRARREPVSHLVGEREFWSLPFSVCPAVLDPRSDSETLIETALALFPEEAAPISVLDLGTGSGCLLLALLHERPRACGIGTDASADALAVATENAARLGVADRVSFMRGDWGAALEGVFDLILCNPPYIAADDLAALSPEVAHFEPRLALDGGRDGLSAYRAILPDVARLLAPGGVALLELGADQTDFVAEIVVKTPLRFIDTRNDLAGIPRCMVIGNLSMFTVA